MAHEEPIWSCRWPDPVALKVANDRLLEGMDPERPGLNGRLEVMVRMESMSRDDGLASGILVTPWAVERVYWLATGGEHPPIQSAFPLEPNEEGLIAGGQGVILETSDGPTPVVIALEPETGHHFIQSLQHDVMNYLNSEDALAGALGMGGHEPPPRPKKSVTSHMERKVSRRGLFDLFRG
uniref:Uncharacterized protein n=1 Tax=Magnetococcus massalia (strain MO-1) TaxID=451514 RepID=A0A1S7LMC3_MAGMO|nr:Protein of unknown function [Candidatus Magnetococcus massalia]